MTRLVQLLRDTCAASAAEFALVVPLLALLLFGVIDMGRLMWTVNQAEKATQVGVRMAIVTRPVSEGLINADFASATLPAGNSIPATALGELVCTSTSCACKAGGACPAGVEGVTAAHFDTVLVNRMQDIMPEIKKENVRVTYRGSGLGVAGDALVGPGGGGSAGEVMEISPLVTVSLTGLTFTPTVLFNLVAVNLPSFSATLPAEDSSGTVSN